MTIEHLAVAVIVLGLASIYNTFMIIKLLKQEAARDAVPIRHGANR